MGKAEDIQKVLVDQNGIILGLTVADAESILVQAMLDEMIRLRSTTDKKEKDSIRIFLTESYRALNEGVQRTTHREEN